VANRVSGDVSAFDTQAGGGLEKIGDFATGGLGSLFQSAAVRPDQGPAASFSVRDARFDASSSSDADGRVARYDWDFGDGTVLADGGQAPRHVHGRPGTYRVTLTVTDGEGCSTRLVFTGQSALCNGTPAVRSTQTVSIR
jgi:hypothetical protein